MQEIGKTIFIIGGVTLVLGATLWVFGKLPFIGKLPGDILVKRVNFTLYAPLTTSIVLSIILTIILNLIFKLRR